MSSRCSFRLAQPEIAQSDLQLGTIRDAELGVDVLEMVVDGAHGEDELLGDRFARQAGAGKQCDLDFAAGQRDGGVRGDKQWAPTRTAQRLEPVALAVVALAARSRQRPTQPVPPG